jgi:hypothetical protein
MLDGGRGEDIAVGAGAGRMGVRGGDVEGVDVWTQHDGPRVIIGGQTQIWEANFHRYPALTLKSKRVGTRPCPPPLPSPSTSSP